MLQRTRCLVAAGGLLAAALAGGVAAPAAQAATNLGSTLTAGKQITVGNYLSNGSYRMVMQSDGNLVIYKSNTAVFASFTTGSNNHATFQSDGNLVVYSSAGKSLWNTVTPGSGADKAVMQADGNFVLYDGATSRWATMTNSGRNELHNSHVYSLALSMVGHYDYVYGGGHSSRGPGPTDGYSETLDRSENGNMDCSGFVRWVYYLASGRDIMNGDTSSQLAMSDQHDSVGAPGELIFYDGSEGIHHVGVYGGNGHLINEYSTGYKTLVNSVEAHSGTQVKYYWRSW